MKCRLFTYSLTLALVLGGFNMEKVCAQDPHFTQFYANPLYLNPALAGSNNCGRVALNYRNQWPGLSGTFVTSGASYDQYVEDLHGGLGFLVMTDSEGEGTIRTSRIAAQYAFMQRINRKYSVAFGMEAAYTQKVLDKGRLSFGDMIDPKRGFIMSTNETLPGDGVASNLDISSGMVLYSDQFFAGVAVHHWTRPNESLLQADSAFLPVKYTGHVGATIPLPGSRYSDGAAISPNIMYHQQGAFQEINLGIYVDKGPLTAGVWYRGEDAFIVLLGIKTEHFRFGYSYDVTISTLGVRNSAGAHEISIQGLFPCRKRRPKFRTISCPSF